MTNDALGAKEIAICVPDNCGRLIGKRVPRERLAEALGRGLPMPNFHLVTGIDNKPLPAMQVTGSHTGFRNGRLRADELSRFRVPDEPSTDYYIADALDAVGNPVPEAPRSMLRNQIARLQSHGLRARFASELEFYLFDQSYRELASTGYLDLRPYHHRHGDNDLFVTGIASAFLNQVVEDLGSAGVVVDQVQGEGGIGQLEINVKPNEPLVACDQHAIFKHIVKIRAMLCNRSVTFMAKPFQESAGSGGHVHLCLSTADGEVLLSESKPPRGIAASFIAGVLSHSRAFMAMHVPYANSYRRLRRGSFTPLNVGWAWENRSCLVRLTGSENSSRFEFRLPGADANPYFVYTALIAAGVAGIQENLALPAAISGDSSEADLPSLPRDLTEAVQAFENSSVTAAALGTGVHAHLANLFRHELDIDRGLVTNWDLRRCFEAC